MTARVAEALARGYYGAASGRVRDVPDRRTIRYYTTLGLVDRPAEMRGRTALYGRRHLLQLVAIKKLQASGRTLVEVQERLAGRTDAELANIGETVPEGMAGSAASASTSESTSPHLARAFWKEAPEAEQTEVEPPSSEADAARTGLAGLWIGLPLREGVTLLLAPTRTIEARDVAAIEAAAGPLLRVLTRHQLIEPARGGDVP
ncbi:MAG: MerR family transcriptional regulator [Isosphaeraceae bacterium]